MTNPCHTQQAKTVSVPLKIGNKTGCHFHHLTQHRAGSPSHVNQTRRRNKRYLNWKGVSITKLSLFADDRIMYIENPKDSTKKLLELINEFSKVAGYKINIQKIVAVLYANNERSEREIKKTISFTTGSKRVNYLGMPLMKDVKDLYWETCKTLKKETEDTNKWKHIPYTWIRKN